MPLIKIALDQLAAQQRAGVVLSYAYRPEYQSYGLVVAGGVVVAAATSCSMVVIPPLWAANEPERWAQVLAEWGLQ